MALGLQSGRWEGGGGSHGPENKGEGAAEGGHQQQREKPLPRAGPARKMGAGASTALWRHGLLGLWRERPTREVETKSWWVRVRERMRGSAHSPQESCYKQGEQVKNGQRNVRSMEGYLFKIYRIFVF
jgi:hypothetical protein